MIQVYPIIQAVPQSGTDLEIYKKLNQAGQQQGGSSTSSWYSNELCSSMVMFTK